MSESTIKSVAISAVEAVVEIGVDSLSKLVDLFYKGWEVKIKALADGTITGTDAAYLPSFALSLFGLFGGIGNLGDEVKNLSDTEIAVIVAEAEKYELGEEKDNAQQVLKQLLVTLQTYYHFSK
jgi:hypothetical protein